MAKLKTAKDYAAAIAGHFINGQREREWYLYFDHADGRNHGKIDLVSSSDGWSLRAGAFRRGTDRFYLNYLFSGSWDALMDWLKGKENVDSIAGSIERMALRADED